MPKHSKLDPADALDLRIALSTATDDVWLSQAETAVYLGISPSGLANAVWAGRLPPPVHLGAGPRSMPRWRLGDLRRLGGQAVGEASSKAEAR